MDYIGLGPYPLHAERIYNSGPAESTNWGSKWRGFYDRSVEFVSNGTISTAIVKRGDGKQFYFNASGIAWNGDADVVGKLTRLADANGQPNGWAYTNEFDELESYDVRGELLSITNRTGLRLTFTYSCKKISVTCMVVTPDDVAPIDGLLLKVVDASGRQLNFNYDTVARVVKMTDPSGGVYQYTYSGPIVTDHLVSVTYPDLRTRTYLYGESNLVASSPNNGISYAHALTGIVDENNQRFATWSYDAQGRVTSSEHGVGVEKVTLAFNPNGTTSVTDALGAGRSYQFQIAIGVVKNKVLTRTPDGASRGLTYDGNGNVASRTDFNGNVTTYAYDLSRNLEVQRVEASGTAQARTITTQWHATYRLPTLITEPKKRTTFNYDPAGNLTTRTVQATSDATGSQGAGAAVVGTARTWRYTYNGAGQVLTAVDPNVNVTSYAYDGMGNLTSITNAAGHVTSLGNYDANGRAGQIVDANGLTTNLTYSPRGWLVGKTVTGNGVNEVTSYSYDGVGQLTQVTLPDGSSGTYTYDGAHRLTDVADSLGNGIHYVLDAMGNRTNEQIKDPSGALSRQVTRIYDALNRLQTITGATQ